MALRRGLGSVEKGTRLHAVHSWGGLGAVGVRKRVCRRARRMSTDVGGHMESPSLYARAVAEVCDRGGRACHQAVQAPGAQTGTCLVVQML